MKRSIKTNYLYNLVFEILLLIVPFITAPYISRVLGASNIGKFSFANSIVTYFVVFSTFGSTIYGRRKVAFYRDDKIQLSQVFWNVFFFRLFLSIVALFIYYIIIVKNNGEKVLALILGLNIINVFCDISWFFQGIEYFKELTIKNSIIRLLAMTSIFVLVKSKADLWIYVLIHCLQTVLSSLVMWPSLHDCICWVPSIHPFQDIKEMFLVFLPTIAIQVYAVLDKSMIGWITASDYANGCYEQAEKIAKIGIMAVSSVSSVVLPRVANLYKNNSLSEAKDYIYKAFHIVWMISIPSAFGLISISSVFIPFYYGEGYESAVGLLCIFSLLVVFISIAYVVGQSWLIPTEQQNVYTVAVTIAAVINLFMNWFLIRKYSAFGAAVATVAAEAIGAIIQLGYCVYNKQLEMSKVTNSLWKYILAGMIMFVALLYIKRIHVSSFALLILMIVSGSLVYLIMLIVLKDDFFLSNTRMVFKKIKLKILKSK